MLHCYIACLLYNLEERPNSVALSIVAGFILRSFNSRTYAFVTEAHGEIASTYCLLQNIVTGIYIGHDLVIQGHFPILCLKLL